MWYQHCLVDPGCCENGCCGMEWKEGCEDGVGGCGGECVNVRVCSKCECEGVQVRMECEGVNMRVAGEHVNVRVGRWAGDHVSEYEGVRVVPTSSQPLQALQSGLHE